MAESTLTAQGQTTGPAGIRAKTKSILIQDDPSQPAAARRPIRRCVAEGSTLFVPATVVLELEWLLRSSFAFGKDDVPLTLSSLFSAAEPTFAYSTTKSGLI